MPAYNLVGEASDCRFLVEEFRGRAEARLLRRLASEFERLAVERDWPLGFHRDDSMYFARRAAQEVTAAVRAEHPKARLAHLKMAQRYDGLSAPSESTERRSTGRYDDPTSLKGWIEGRYWTMSCLAIVFPSARHASKR